MNNVALVKQYFENFSNKRIDLLEQMFSQDVELTDWEISAKGIDQVVAANQKIFNSVETITVDIDLLAEVNNTIFAQISVIVNSSTTIKVIDVITFDQEGKISKVSAYKQ
jgi:steroid delta-isomerase